MNLMEIVAIPVQSKAQYSVLLYSHKVIWKKVYTVWDLPPQLKTYPPAQNLPLTSKPTTSSNFLKISLYSPLDLSICKMLTLGPINRGWILVIARCGKSAS